MTSRKAGKTKKPTRKPSTSEVRALMKSRLPATQPRIPTLYSVYSDDLDLLEQVAERLAGCGARLYDAEVVRAGLVALSGMETEKIIEIVLKLPKGKPGRKGE